MSQSSPNESASSPSVGALDALMKGTAIIELSSMALVRISGADAASYLQTKLTANVSKWPPSGGFALATDINGKLLFEAQVHVLASSEPFDAYMMVDASVAEDARAHLERFVIMEDVTIGGPLDDLRLFTLRGPGVAAVVEALELPMPDAATGALTSRDIVVARRSFLGEESVDLLVPVARVADVRSAATAAGAVLATEEDVLQASVLLGEPLFGQDYFAGENIPLEAGLWRGISFVKGCYLGQEVIERLFARGKPNKRLMRVRWSGDAVPPRTELAGTKTPPGFITRSSDDGSGGAVGFAYVRRRYLEGDDTLYVGEGGPELIIEDYVGGEAPADGGLS